MRIEYATIFSLLCLVLTACTISAMRSRKVIGGAVAFLVCAILPPVIGNLAIVCTKDQTEATIGYYVYFLGMDLVMYSLLNFTFAYCNIKKPNKIIKYGVYFLLIADVIQYALNPFFGHAFDTEAIFVEESIYYRLVPKLGQTYHRIIDYGIYFFILVTFLVKMLRSVRIYAERYYVIFFSLFVGGVWETFYIFSRTPIDRSMIGFVVFGLLTYYFALYYRPMRLLDRMLANMASEIPEALYFFDVSGQCFWANKPGIKLAGIEDEDYSQAKKLLTELFGDLDLDKEEWSTNKIIGTGTEEKYYVLEKRSIPYSENKNAGTFLSVRDNTLEQQRLKKEIHAATHDGLTDLYNKEHLYKCIEDTIKNDDANSYVLVYANINNFKMINDVFGSKFGDCVLIDIANRIKNYAPPHCIYGRIVGDIFAMCMPADEFDDAEIESMLGRFRIENNGVGHTVLLHLGVYFIPDKNIEVSVMVDRARMALDPIKNDYRILMAYYDNAMREQVLWAPGFLHAKMLLSDDKVAFVGTINLDYRSLTHHYECGAVIGKAPCLADIKKDFEHLIEVSEEITPERAKKLRSHRPSRMLLHIFEPIF